MNKFILFILLIISSCSDSSIKIKEEPLQNQKVKKQSKAKAGKEEIKKKNYKKVSKPIKSGPTKKKQPPVKIKYGLYRWYDKNGILNITSFPPPEDKFKAWSNPR
ncbi:hypothetical protein ACFL35_05165 [Candidatus Riflebacteria bacterium]